MRYTNVKKFKHSQRLWKGSDGRHYLADESGDKKCPVYYSRDAGQPDETDDGPLAIIETEPIHVDWSKGTGDNAVVTVDTIDDSGRATVSVTMNCAMWLSAHLGMTIKTRYEEYRVNALPEVPSGQ